MFRGKIRRTLSVGTVLDSGSGTDYDMRIQTARTAFQGSLSGRATGESFPWGPICDGGRWMHAQGATTDKNAAGVHTHSVGTMIVGH